MNSFFKRLFLADFWKGMILTFRTQNPKNIYTEQYPLERPMVAERYRGAPRLNMNPETGETLCIACNLCSLACPENLIVVGWHRDDATRRKVLTNFTYDTSRCMFCGLVRRCLPDRLPRADAGLRDGFLFPRRRDLGPAPPGRRPHARAVHALSSARCAISVVHGISRRHCSLRPASTDALHMKFPFRTPNESLLQSARLT